MGLCYVLIRIGIYRHKHRLIGYEAIWWVSGLFGNIIWLLLLLVLNSCSYVVLYYVVDGCKFCYTHKISQGICMYLPTFWALLVLHKYLKPFLITKSTHMSDKSQCNGLCLGCRLYIILQDYFRTRAEKHNMRYIILCIYIAGVIV